MFKREEVIHCIGDSHVDVFSGKNSIQPAWPTPAQNILPLFRTCRIGAVLAYNLSTPGHATRRILEKVIDRLPMKSILMIVAGEVDCRVHIVKQSRLQNSTIENITVDCVSRYILLLDELRKRKFRLIVWGVIPPTPYDIKDQEYPTNGTFEERKEATEVFNRVLQSWSLKNKVPFISIYDDLIKSGKVQTSYFIDPIHLSTQALPLYYEKLQNIPIVNKDLLEVSKQVYSTDLLVMLIKRKAMYFVIIRVRLYKVVQKCLQILRKKFN